MRYLFVILMLLSVPAYAEIETYVIERSDGGVSTFRLDSESDVAPQSIVDKWQGSYTQATATGLRKIDPTTLPSKADRNYWKHSNGQVVVDTVKKQQDETEKEAKADRKAAVLAKLKISEEEFKDLVGGK